LLDPAILHDMRTFVDAGCTGPGLHVYNAHFPGLYSIVLANEGGLLRRMFIARPGELHPALQTTNGLFLWHAHGYDFVETVVLGSAVNVCVRPGSRVLFRCYEFKSGIIHKARPTLMPTGKVLFDEYRCELVHRGKSFAMEASEIHRVVFHPCEKTGWFVCYVQETRKAGPATTVYSPEALPDVPDADILYQPISEYVAKQVVAGVLGALEEIKEIDG
jgi:hypothetical protein